MNKTTKRFKAGQRVRLISLDTYAGIPAGATGTCALIAGWKGKTTCYCDPHRLLVFVEWDKYGAQSVWSRNLEHTKGWDEREGKTVNTTRDPIQHHEYTIQADYDSGRRTWGARITDETGETVAVVPALHFGPGMAEMEAKERCMHLHLARRPRALYEPTPIPDLYG